MNIFIFFGIFIIKTKIHYKLFFRDKWTNEEDLFILESIDKHGKKWSNIANKMKGRHENAVKNRFVSIIRALKKEAKKDHRKKFDQTDIKSVIEAFLRSKPKFALPKKEKKRENIIINREFDSNIKINREIEIENNKSTFQSPMLTNLNTLEFSMNFDTNFPNEPFERNNNKKESRLIYDVSSCFLPNMYLAENNKISPRQESFLKLIRQENPFFEMDEISQNMSSLSLSDQILNEANKILSNITSSIPENSLLSSFKNEKSSSLINSNSRDDQKKLSILTPLVDKTSTMPPIPSGNHLLRRQTQNFDLVLEESKEAPAFLIPKPNKKKSFTAILPSFEGQLPNFEKKLIN